MICVLVYQQICEGSKFGSETRAAQARFAEIAPDGVVFDRVKFVPRYSSWSISFFLAGQPRRADTLVPRGQGAAAMYGRRLLGMGWVSVNPG